MASELSTHEPEAFFCGLPRKSVKNTTFLLFGRNSETKRYNVIGPTGVMVVMHWATNAPLTKIREIWRNAARIQVASKIKEA